MAKKVTATTPRTTMTTISTVFLPEEDAEEEVELAGDVAAEPIGREELPAVPTTGVVLIGIV